jgi:Big-like domain-containing protein
MRIHKTERILGAAALGFLILAGGAANAASVTVNFDILPDGSPYVAQTTFAATAGPLREEWAADGVHFLGGGGVLTGNSGVYGTSGLNLLAFDVRLMAAYQNGTIPAPPEQISFDQPADLVRINVGSVAGGTATLTAFDVKNNPVGSAQLALSSTVAPLWVQSSSYNIVSVKLALTGCRSMVADDLVVVIQDHANVPPSTTCALDGPAGNGCFLGDVQATLTSTDPDDTVAATRYNLDNSGWQPYSSPVTITGNGSHTLQFQSVDSNGNWEDVKSQSLEIDTTRPTTTCTLDGPTGNNGCFLGDVTATLAATDPDDAVAATQYNLDGGGWQPYSSPVSITGNGPHTLQFQSQDSDGNWEAVKSQSLKIDTTRPATQCVLSGPAGANGWYTGPVQATLTASDPDDAVAATRCRTDGGAWQPYTAPVTISGDGTHTLEYQSQDSSGNWEGVQSENVKIDTTPPSVQLSPSPSILMARHDYVQEKRGHKSDPRDMVPVVVSGAASDAVSGVASVQFQVKDEYGQVQPALARFGQTILLQATVKPDDRDGRWYTLTVTVTDNAGQKSSVSGLVRVLKHRLLVHWR